MEEPGVRRLLVLLNPALSRAGGPAPWAPDSGGHLLALLSDLAEGVGAWGREEGQAPLSMGFSRQEYWSGLPFPSPGDLPNPGIEPGSLALQADLYCLSHQALF